MLASGKLLPTWWPWGAGMFATSLGPHDACFVVAANEQKHSGWMVNWWLPAAIQKEIIETTKVNECKWHHRHLHLALCPPHASQLVWQGTFPSSQQGFRHMRLLDRVHSLHLCRDAGNFVSCRRN